MPKTANPSEVEAYAFIRDQLKEAGWDIRRPPAGSVWTQNQCFSDEALKRALGNTRPENVVRLSSDAVWVIEAKSERQKLDLAIREAQEDYADPITNKSGQYRAVLATGIAGDEENGYLVKTTFATEDGWKPVLINGKETTGFLTPQDTDLLLKYGKAEVADFVPRQQVFQKAAEKINKLLHDGGINKNDRAKVIAALLLATLEDPPRLDSRLSILIRDINSRSKLILEQNDKPAFAQFVQILEPTDKKNHVKYRSALVRTIQELENLNIRSAMNSDTDILGQFYEKFLKYGNGAKEIGIVLTPRHITRFAAELVDVDSNDIVLDPACGTGGFLVAAFDHVRRGATPAEVDRFKQYGLFGIEQDPYIAILAIVNMIFRGDGRHNIAEGNALSTHLQRTSKNGFSTAEFVDDPAPESKRSVTKVLMNPPFSLSTSKEQEYRFVNAALAEMADGGILFSLLPLDSMFGTKDELAWRRNDLLRQNSLLAVISLPEELFYPAAQKQVVAIIVRKGRPHNPAADVFWGRIEFDGHIKVKSKRLAGAELDPPRSVPDQIPEVALHAKAFLGNPQSYKCDLPRLAITAPIDFTDPLLELLPEAYLSGVPVTAGELQTEVDRLARETASFLIRYGAERREDA